MRRILLLLCLLALPLWAASAQLVPSSAAGPEMNEPAAAVLQAESLSVGSCSLSWPRVTGMKDEEVQKQINDAILQAGNVQQLIARAPQVMSAPDPLILQWEGMLKDEVLSLRFSARGPVSGLRATQVLSCLNLDLRDGKPIALDAIFISPDEACEAIGQYVTDTVLPGLNGYLDTAELLPLPESWYIDAQGITFCYDIQAYATLSERAGTLCIRWYELTGLLKLGEGTLLRRIGAEQAMTLSEDNRLLIAESVASGCLPDIPVKLGDGMKQAVDDWRMLTDPDLCEAGRLFALEDDRFRDVRIITDALGKGWDDSIVQGLRSDRCCFYGLITGTTTREEWQRVLGEPDSSLSLQGDSAEAWRLSEGISDYYVYGDYRLRLHCGQDGVLDTVLLTQ